MARGLCFRVLSDGGGGGCLHIAARRGRGGRPERRAPAGSGALRRWSLVGVRTPFPRAGTAAARGKVGRTAAGGAPVSEESGDGQPAAGATRRAPEGRQMRWRRIGRREGERD